MLTEEEYGAQRRLSNEVGHAKERQRHTPRLILVVCGEVGRGERVKQQPPIRNRFLFRAVKPGVMANTSITQYSAGGRSTVLGRPSQMGKLPSHCSLHRIHTEHTETHRDTHSDQPFFILFGMFGVSG